jgi:hypothetical protein
LSNLAAVCERCEHKDPYVPSDWFAHIWFLYCLQRGGYPFGQDDLSLDEWMALGEMKAEIESLKVL